MGKKSMKSHIVLLEQSTDDETAKRERLRRRAFQRIFPTSLMLQRFGLYLGWVNKAQVFLYHNVWLEKIELKACIQNIR